ncbi:DUF551 domain-containing protein [Citrobacter portucalensis]|uniref:DUF551 domain-containing protein n=1 Tax=Citrobacter portucalensis TaxID=1639133 RepID=UPI00388E4C7B
MTTNNHPAHGPVSLDRLHQIREILSKAAAQSDGGNLGYAMADAVKVIDVAIASFCAEPVAEIKISRGGYDKGEKIIDYFSEEIQHLTEGRKLYTATPAPVVPPAIEPEYEVIKAILPTANPDEYACCIAADMWNACRAAMLQAGNYPVTPDAWIPVSERMPNDKDFVWCYGYVSGWTESDGFEAYYDATRNKWWTIDDETVRKVTHWMPLPAAPQR